MDLPLRTHVHHLSRLARPAKFIAAMRTAHRARRKLRSARKTDHHIFFDDKAAMREAGFGLPWNSRLAPPHLA
jgi:hypothetical protein